LISLIIDKPIKPNLAMTGELTLTGKVLKIGGVKEKILAAKRESIKELIFPAQNKNEV
jgi:ATP-dependent Lon protease